MIDLYLPPKAELWTPARPAIVRPGRADAVLEGASAALARAGVPRDVRRAVAAELKRLALGRSVTPSREELDDLARFAGAGAEAFRKPAISVITIINPFIHQAPVAKSLSFQGSAVNSANQTTYSFASQPLGTATSDRIIIVVVHGSGASVTSISSVTIAGVGATIQINAVPNGGDSIGMAIATAPVPSGATGTIEFTCNAGAARAGLGIWAAYGLPSGTPVDTDSSTANDPSRTLTTVAGGFAIASAAKGQGTATHTFTNATERYDANTEAGGGSHAGGDASTTGANLTITIARSSDTVEQQSVFASW